MFASQNSTELSKNQVRHFSLIPLNTAKTLEGLTGAFSETVSFPETFFCIYNMFWLPSRNFSVLFQRGKDRYVAVDDYRSKAKDQISVKKGDIFYVVSSKKHDKKWLYGHVAGGETLGLVPARVLQKDCDENNVNEDGES